MEKKPLLSIIIPSYNAEAFLNECIVSIYESDFRNFELIIIDNGSINEIRDFIDKHFLFRSNFKLLRLNQNRGSSFGRSYGAKQARGDFLLFLDADTVLKKDCLTTLVNFIRDFPHIGAVHAKLLNLERPEFYDCAGNYLDPFGFLVNRANGRKDTGDLDYVYPILSGKSAAVLVSKAMYRKLRGFDEDYFFLVEDTDFDWRLWLEGHPVVFFPRAVVYHRFNTSRKNIKGQYYYPNCIYYGSRNYLLTLLKNLGAKSLAQIVPLHIFCWLAMSLAFLLKGKVRNSWYIIRGLGWNLANLPLVLKKRYFVQSRRIVSDKDINFLFLSYQKPSYYLKKIFSYIR